MNPEELVACMRRDVLETTLAIYRRYLEHPTGATSGAHSEWARIAEIYGSLSDEQRSAMMAVLRIAIVDTLSAVFGILDGTTLIEKYRETFRLTYGDDAQQLNGDLQDLFLSEEAD